jgi:hypothetical protein
MVTQFVRSSSIVNQNDYERSERMYSNLGIIIGIAKTGYGEGKVEVEKEDGRRKTEDGS